MDKITMAYCPTMEPFAQEIENNLENVKMIPASSAREVLQFLRYNRVDSVLIGRVAEKRELDENTKFFRLKKGLTLVYKVKSGISVEQLKNVEVLTYLDLEKIAHVKDFFARVVHLDSLEECLKYNLNVPVLVDWEDFRDDFSLLIPMTMTGKAPEFRAPVIYYKKDIDEGILRKIKEIV